MYNTIYFVTVMKCHKDIDLKFTNRPTRQRCCGWFSSFEEAEKIVLNNISDIFEDDYYDLALIEKIPEGLLSYSDEKDNVWYEAKYSNSELRKHRFGWILESIEKIETPEFAKCIVGWAIG